MEDTITTQLREELRKLTSENKTLLLKLKNKDTEIEAYQDKILHLEGFIDGLQDSQKSIIDSILESINESNITLFNE